MHYYCMHAYLQGLPKRVRAELIGRTKSWISNAPIVTYAYGSTVIPLVQIRLSGARN